MQQSHPRTVADATTISFKEPRDAEHWCRRYGVGEAELRLAMREVGDSAAEVDLYLRRPLAAPRWGERWE